MPASSVLKRDQRTRCTGQSAASRHRCAVAWPAPEAGRAFQSTLADARFNSSNPSLQFVRNWLMNSQRATRRSRPVLICQLRHLAREHFRLATVTVWERRILDRSPSLRGLGTISKHQDGKEHDLRVDCLVERIRLRYCMKQTGGVLDWVRPAAFGYCRNCSSQWRLRTQLRKGSRRLPLSAFAKRGTRPTNYLEGFGFRPDRCRVPWIVGLEGPDLDLKKSSLACVP